MKRLVLIAAVLCCASPLLAQEESEHDEVSEAHTEESTTEDSAPEAVDEAAEAVDDAPEAVDEAVQPGDAAEANVVTPQAGTPQAAAPQEAAAPEAPGARAKFALVIVGDADAVLQSRAAELSTALHDAGLTGVHDGAISEALTGATPRDDDGLDSLRAARRSLSLTDDPREQADALERIGRASGADALVLIARRAPTLRVYDLGARSFFQDVPEGPTHIRFIVRATRAAAQRALTEPAAVAAASEEDAQVGEDEEEVPPVRAFFRKNWPYMVAGVLLAGAIIWLVVGSADNDDAPPPVLRFRPGGSE